MDSVPNALNIENSMDLLLVLLYAPDGKCEPIEGITRLQKLMFLLKQGVGPNELINQAKDLNYIPYKMGPFSDQLNQDIQELNSAGLISTERLHYTITDDIDEGASSDTDYEDKAKEPKRVESVRFALTDFGKQVSADLWGNMRQKQQKELSEFKRFFNSLTLRQLLIYVYEKFSDYTDKSEIKQNLGF